jgi:hypothetical protein
VGQRGYKTPMCSYSPLRIGICTCLELEVRWFSSWITPKVRIKAITATTNRIIYKGSSLRCRSSASCLRASNACCRCENVFIYWLSGSLSRNLQLRYTQIHMRAPNPKGPSMRGNTRLRPKRTILGTFSKNSILHLLCYFTFVWSAQLGP